MFSARGVALNVTTASVQLRMLQNSVYLQRGQSYQQLTVVVVQWCGFRKAFCADMFPNP
jgi:hypothetical protein